jgi:hypothetical protein
MMTFNKGDKIVVTDDFDYDSATFLTGMTGTVLKFHSDRGIGGMISIEWDHEDKQNFHSCGGLCLNHRGYNLDVHDAKLGPITLDIKANPLPDDPRLRGIAIKIKQMETRFKVRQLAKLKQKEQANEVSQSVSLQDGIVVSTSSFPSSWVSESSF